jgi:protein-tyrosine phosphatase
LIDLHCHILPGLDDGARDLGVALDMARIAAADGIQTIVCTPHILPGLYHNTGPRIRFATDQLRDALAESNIGIDLFSGSDAHMTTCFTEKLVAGEILPLARSRYVLVEPPRHVAPIQLEAFFSQILIAGYVPVLTHPERLTWVGTGYRTIKRIARSGAWMQITSDSLVGKFGRQARYWAERMLDEGLVHLLASDAHDIHSRPPILSAGRQAVARRLGEHEAKKMVSTRPRGVIENAAPSHLPLPPDCISAELPNTA